jgi:hypothetical protein
VTERTPLQLLIDALAKRAALEYLTPKPAPDRAEAEKRPERVSLPRKRKAA